MFTKKAMKRRHFAYTTLDYFPAQTKRLYLVDDKTRTASRMAFQFPRRETVKALWRRVTGATV